MGGWLPALSGLLALCTMACQPKIGDDCQRDLDCSQLGDKSCDTTQENGYCTQFGCSPSSCPKDESICVAFGSVVSEVEACQNLGRPSPYVRNVCMRYCASNEDCRLEEGYRCVDLNEQNPYGAEVIQEEPRSTSVCMVPTRAAETPSDRSAEVCLGPGGASSE